MFTTKISDNGELYLVQPSFAKKHLEIVQNQQDYLGEFLPWVEHAKDEQHVGVTSSTQPCIYRLISRNTVENLILVPLLAISTFALAETEYSYSYNVCMENSGDTTSNMLDCLSDEIERQDARLNTAYRALMARLPEAQKTALRNSQRAWIRSKDIAVNAEARRTGGTIDALNSSFIYLQMTAEKADELEQRLARLR